MDPLSPLRKLKRLIFPPPPQFPPAPVEARDASPSMVFSEDDQPYRPSPRLMDLALAAIAKARTGINLEDLARRAGEDYVPTLWPGEHYVLLAACIAVLQPKVVIEIGTFTGVSALAMKQYLPPDGRIATFDVKDRRSETEWVLRDADFADKRLEYHIGNLADWPTCEKHRELLESADFLFIDGPKDHVTEFKFIENFRRLTFRNKPILFFDDTRLWSMLKFWRTLAMPKLDLTSFGHWSGSGLAEWT
jgi:predicted O-methyltransferase YrrM